MMLDQRLQLARQLADLFASFPQVEAVALGGSLVSGAALDPTSDLDLYVYTTALIPLPERISLVEAAGGASRADFNLDYWDLGDEWFHAPTGTGVDVAYWDTQWIKAYLSPVVEQHRPSLGFTTAHWHTVRFSQPLFDRSGWFARLKSWVDQPYPETLRRFVILRNRRLLTQVISSYRGQLEKALRRGDRVSVLQRVSDILSSYFDIVFAFNRVLHPGQKRMVEQAARLCPRLPADFAKDIDTLLRSADGEYAALEAFDRLIENLDHLLMQDGFTAAGE
jgi:predicted nucleotidyltransferase